MQLSAIQSTVEAALKTAFTSKPVFSWDGKNFNAIEDAVVNDKLAIVVYPPESARVVSIAQGKASMEASFNVGIHANPEGTDDVDALLTTAIATVLAIVEADARGRKTFTLQDDPAFEALPLEGQRGWVIHFSKHINQ